MVSLIKLYTSLRFWAGLLLIFFLVLIIMGLTRGATFGSSILLSSLYTLYLMPSSFLLFISLLIEPLFGNLGSAGKIMLDIFMKYIIPTTIWIIILGTITWLKIKKEVTSPRVIKIVGLFLLMFLIVQFASCVMIYATWP